MGSAKSFHSLKGGRGGGAQTVLPCLQGVGTKSFRLAIFPFRSPPFPVINDQSLSCLRRGGGGADVLLHINTSGGGGEGADVLSYINTSGGGGGLL